MKSSVHNQTLKEQMERLTKRAFTWYNAIVSHYSAPLDVLQTSTLMHQQENTVKGFDEYKRCKELVNADARMSALLGKLVGTILGMSTTGDADICIMHFIEQLYLSSNDKMVAPLAFDERYAAFEELFYADTLRFIDTVRLYNFESEVEEIVLEEGLVIKKVLQVQDVQTSMHERRYRPYTQFSKSDFVIERTYTAPKLVGGFTQTSEQVDRELNESAEVFDLVIKALRIAKSSAVYREHGITTEQLTFSPYAGITSKFLFIENTILGNKCGLSAQDATEIKTLFAKIRHTKSSSYKIASNRLGFGMERRSDEDKLLDYMIGLESLYLPDGHTELTFRLSLRVAFMINKEMADRKRDFNFLKKMYDVRSKIAHGKEYKLTKEDLAKIEEILRQSLKLYLASPSNFRKENLDNLYFTQ